MAVKISGLKSLIVCAASLFLPADNGTLFEPKFEVHFKRLTTTQRDELNRKFAAGEITVRQLLDEVVVGWGGMSDENGDVVTYSHAERIATDDAYPGTEQSMGVAWFDSAFVNQREAAIKNSKALSATTSA